MKSTIIYLCRLPCLGIGWYEVVRKLQEKAVKKRDCSKELTALRYKIELVRVPLAKLRIAYDFKIKEPIWFGFAGAPPSLRQPYTGDVPFDYNPPILIATETGSVVWKVYSRKDKLEHFLLAQTRRVRFEGFVDRRGFDDNPSFSGLARADRENG